MTKTQIKSETDKIILPDNFFKSLAEAIARKVYKDGSAYLTLPGHYYNSDFEIRKKAGASSEFILLEIKKMYENIPSSVINISWNDIETRLEENDLLIKLYDISDKINLEVEELRGNLHTNLYKKLAMFKMKSMGPEAYVDPRYAMKKQQHNYYTDKIEKELSSYLVNLENALDNNLQTEQIEILQTSPGEKIATIDIGATDSLRFLADISKGVSQIFYEILGNSYSRLRKKLKLKEGDIIPLEPYEAKILTQFSKALVQAHITDVKERAKNLPEVYSGTYKEVPGPYMTPQEQAQKRLEELLKKPKEETYSETAVKKMNEGVGWVTSVFGYKSEEEKPKESTDEDKKKINPSNQANRLGKVRSFVYRHGTKSLMAIGGATFIASGFYSGGLTILPIIGFAPEATATMLFFEGTIGAAIGAVFGKTASYITRPKDEFKQNETSTLLPISKNIQPESYHHREALAKQPDVTGRNR